MRTFLHLGAQKTGTTSAQVDFSEHRRALARRGVLYPGKSFKHGCLFFASKRPAQVAGGAWREWLEIRKEIEGWHGRVLLSEETLFGAGPRRLETAVRMIEEAAGERPAAIVYLRNPLDQTVSLAQQTLKGGSRTLADLSHAPVLYDLEERLGLFGRLFDTLILRPFDRARLVGGTTQCDLLATIGVKRTGFLKGAPRNERMSMAAAYAVDALHARHPRPRDMVARRSLRPVVDRLLEVPGPPFALPRATLARLSPVAERDMDWLERTHGLSLPSTRVVAREDLGEVFPPETRATLARVLAGLDLGLDVETVLARAETDRACASTGRLVAS